MTENTNSYAGWTEENFLGLEDAFACIEKRQTEIRAELGQPDHKTPEEMERTRNAAEIVKTALKNRDIGPVLASVSTDVPDLLRREIAFETVVQQLARVGEAQFNAFEKEYSSEPDRLVRAYRAYSKLVNGITAEGAAIYAKLRVSHVQEEQKNIIRQLSTPVINVWEDILVMPLIGVVDSVRARQMMERLLARITTLGSRIVILDVTGVPTVDTEVANHFIRTTRAARLVGAQTILVGITPEVALTLVRLNVGLEGLETYSDLRSGLERALQLLGYEVRRVEKRVES